MSKSIGKNLFYNLLFQIVTLFMPLITTPYVSRVLGKEGIGIYSYTLSIVQYFIILGTLGISMYGNRTIAYVRDNKEKMSKTFWSITILKLVTTGLALVVFMVIFGFNKKYSYIYIIQSMNVLAAMVDISWLYMGLEDFKKTVTRNLIVKIIGVVCIFLFVKEYSDLSKYVIINGLMLLLGNLVMWAYLPRTVSKCKVKLKDITSHFIPAIQLFIPQIAIQIYVVLDKSMLGTLGTVGDVGLYEQSQKIIKLVLGLVTSLGIVMLPRMSNTFASGNIKKLNEYLNNSLKAVIYASIPMAIGLAATSNNFVPWFFGAGFESVSLLMMILTPILVLISISNVLGTQYLLPSNRTKKFTVSVTTGSIINIILNFILIPKIGAIGACIATVFAELSVTIVQYIFVRKNIEKKPILINLAKYIISGTIMFSVVSVVGTFMKANILTTIIQVIVGSITYFVGLLILKEEMNLMVINIIRLKLNKLIKMRRDNNNNNCLC